jgi:hypothetical protein
MTMPKTTINKNSNAIFGKYEIRPTEYFGISPPTLQGVRSKKPN